LGGDQNLLSRPPDDAFAPIPVIPAVMIEPPESTLLGHSALHLERLFVH